MKKRRLNRRTPLTALFLVLAVALVLGGTYQGATEKASAVTILPPFPSFTLPPVLIASDFSPADGEEEVALNKNVTVTFNRDVDPTTLKSSTFYVTKSGSPSRLTATITYNAPTKTATLNPSSNLSPGTTYEVTLTDGIESTGGLTLFNPKTWSFTTIAPPEILSRDPAPGATAVPLDQTVLVTFDKKMDWATVTSSSFYLQDSEGDVVAASLIKSLDKRTAGLNPLADLEADETYVVTLTTAVEAENGLSLESTVVWSFTTAAGAPTLTAKVPANGAIDVPVDQMISATFDMDMDASTITSATFYIQKSGGTPLPAEVGYSAATHKATLDPPADLEAGATYQVTLSSAVKSETGVALAGAPVTWSFTTAAGGGPGGITFTDVPPGHPYYDAINDLASRGIIGGYGGGRFGPGDPIRRQQFAKMIVGTLGLPVQETDFPNPDMPFTDLGADDLTDLYPHEYVAVCARNAITLGKTPTTFDPYSYITRYQVISMVVRAADGRRPGLLVAPPAGFGTWRGDSVHGANAARAEYNGLLSGLSLSALNPYGNMSRGEVAQILHNLIVLLSL